MTTGLLLATIAQPEVSPAVEGVMSGNRLVFWLMVLAAMALLPFVLTIATSFAKLVVVGGLLRQALGTPQIPPTTVITGLALILTVHIMWPVVSGSYADFSALRLGKPQVPDVSGAATQQEKDRIRAAHAKELLLDAAAGTEPHVHGFLLRHSHARNIALFEGLRGRLGKDAEKPEALLARLTGSVEEGPVARLGYDLTVLAPAFVLSELTEAFQIGFLLFIPFLIIDLVVSNVLLAMGMHMLAPTTISLPLKLLVFVMMDGWTLILRGVVLGYV